MLIRARELGRRAGSGVGKVSACIAAADADADGGCTARELGLEVGCRSGAAARCSHGVLAYITRTHSEHTDTPTPTPTARGLRGCGCIGAYRTARNAPTRAISIPALAAPGPTYPPTLHPLLRPSRARPAASARPLGRVASHTRTNNPITSWYSSITISMRDRGDRSPAGGEVLGPACSAWHAIYHAAALLSPHHPPTPLTSTYASEHPLLRSPLPAPRTHAFIGPDPTR